MKSKKVAQDLNVNSQSQETTKSFVSEMNDYFQKNNEYYYSGQSMVESFIQLTPLVQEERIALGVADWLSVDILRLRNLFDKKKVNGIIIRDSSKGTKAILDQDEVDNFISAIVFFKKDIVGSPAGKYKAIKFKSRSGFEASCYAKESKTGMSVNFAANSYDRCHIELDEKYIDTLLGFLQQSKNLFEA